MEDHGEGAGFLTLARLVRVHGRRGELAAEMETEQAGVFESFPEVQLWDGGKRRRPARIVQARPHQNRLLLRFDGVDTIEGAEGLVGWEVQIPMEKRPPPRLGHVYVSDLMGCQVTEARSGRRLGEVRGWVETGGTPLLEVRDGQREILIPFAASICQQIDTEGKSIRVDLPEGLDDLNE